MIGEIIGGIAGGLLGGGDKESTVSNEPWSGVQQYLKDLYARAAPIGNNPMPAYPYQNFANFTPTEVAGQQDLLNYTQNQFMPGVGGLQQGLAGTIGQQYNPNSNPYMNYYQQMFNAPAGISNDPQLNALKQANERQVTDSFMRKTMPAIRSGAQMAGQYGGSREALASGVAQGDAAEALANASAAADMSAWNTAMGQQRAGAQLMGQGFGQQTTASLDAMRQMPNALQLGFMGPAQAMNIGSQYRDLEQQRINQAMHNWQYPQTSMQDSLGWLSNLLQGMNTFGTRTTTQPGNMIGNALGGAALGGSLWNNWNSGNTPNLGYVSPPQNTFNTPGTVDSYINWGANL